ncbi:hypothetical protein [Streptomyces sp. NPDC088348]|uniref:hypothetical protein n=1 Tax=Streptomyces sp. NPDC088348 TaxID=3365853 RepID=UPI0038023FA8
MVTVGVAIRVGRDRTPGAWPQLGIIRPVVPLPAAKGNDSGLPWDTVADLARLDEADPLGELVVLGCRIAPSPPVRGELAPLQLLAHHDHQVVRRVTLQQRADGGEQLRKIAGRLARAPSRVRYCRSPLTRRTPG